MAGTIGHSGDSSASTDTLPSLGMPAESDLRPPPSRPGFVVRRSLVETLTTTDADVITLVAPAGYGKTTTLAQWARVETAPLAWLCLRKGDNGPQILLSHLAISMKLAGVMTTEDVAHFKSIGDAATTFAAADHFARVLNATAGDPAVVVIDNAEFLKGRAANDVIVELARQLDGRLRIAIASHSTPAIRLPALRASGRLLEITGEQLAFEVDEIERMVTELDLDPKIADEIMERTEGWPAPAFLMALAARDRRLGPDEVPVGSRRSLHQFVKSEIIPQLSRRGEGFLTLMSPLDRMSGPLCDAVDGDDDSRRLLESLERETHLVHRVGSDDTWFAMNPVLRDALYSELEHHEPERTRAVHASAAAWYEENGMLVEAIGHALKAEDKRAFAQLMERLIKIRYVTGHVADVLNWMKWLDENVSLEDYPGLAAIGALVHIQEGHVLETERWLDVAAQGRVDRDTETVIGIVRASTASAGVEKMMRDIDAASAAAGPGSRWLPAILVVRGLAHLMNGDSDLAEASFVEAAGTGMENKSSSSAILALGHRALIAIGRHDWDLAQRLSDQAVAVIDENGLDGYLTSGPPLIAAARCARHTNDISAAQRLLARAARARPRLGAAMPGESVKILLEMARAHIELSDVAGARPLIREAEDIIVLRPDLGVLPDELAAVKESLASVGPGKIGPPTLTKAELRLLPFLATHMSFREIGQELFVSHHTIKSQATSIYRKLGASTRSEAMARAFEIGLIAR